MRRTVWGLPLTRTALLSPRESAVLSFIFSTRRCFTFFMAKRGWEEGEEGGRREGERGREEEERGRRGGRGRRVEVISEVTCVSPVLFNYLATLSHSPISILFPLGGSILLKVMVMGP